MKITRAQLKRIIKEEIEAVDEGFLDKIKGMFGKGGPPADLAKYAEMFPEASEKQLARHAKFAAEVEGLEGWLDEIGEEYGHKAMNAAYKSLTKAIDYRQGRCDGDPWECAPIGGRTGVFGGARSAGNWSDIVSDKKDALEAAKQAVKSEKWRKEREEKEEREKEDSAAPCGEYRRGSSEYKRCMDKRSEDRVADLGREADWKRKRGEYGYHASQEGSWGLEERLDRIAQKVEERLVRHLRKKK